MGNKLKRGLLKVFLLCVLLSLLGSGSASATDRFDQTGGGSHPYEAWSRPPPSGGGGGGWGGGTQGQYYHYHVPLVGSQPQAQGWGWAPEGGGKGGHDVIIWVLVGLLLLGLLASLFLPLLLIPLGLSLLALLLGGMMMMAGGGMMMMMMMMMMPNQPQPASRTELVGRALETMSKMVAGDTEGAITNILSSLELESYCPERAACNLGSSLTGVPLPLGLDVTPLLDKLGGWKKDGWLELSPLLPPALSSHSRGRRLVKRMEKAFWMGLQTGANNCPRLEKRCKKLREQNQANLWMSHHNNGTTTPTPTQPSTPDPNQPQPHAVIVEEGESLSSHPQLAPPTFSTPTILM